jgi:hypothetical protein
MQYPAIFDPKVTSAPWPDVADFLGVAEAIGVLEDGWARILDEVEANGLLASAVEQGEKIHAESNATHPDARWLLVPVYFKGHGPCQCKGGCPQLCRVMAKLHDHVPVSKCASVMGRPCPLTHDPRSMSRPLHHEQLYTLVLVFTALDGLQGDLLPGRARRAHPSTLRTR